MLALAIVALVAVVGFQSAWAALACVVNGSARDHCCCKAQRDRSHRDHSDEALRFERQDCCQVSARDAFSAPALREAERIAFDFVPAIESVTPVVLAPAYFERTWSPTEMARPPPARVPLYIDKLAILR